MFKRLCGERNLENVVLLTTMWSELKDEAVGLARERELRRDFWNEMESKGSTIRHFDGTRAMAEAFICRLMRKRNIVLDIQEELVDQEKRLEDTKAGRLIVPRLDRTIDEAGEKIDILGRMIGEAKGFRDEAKIKRLEEQRSTLLEQQQKNVVQRKRLQKRTGLEVADEIEEEEKKGKWKNRLALFASLCGLAITTTINVILPLAGVIAF